MVHTSNTTPRSTVPLYRQRRLWLIVACGAPVLLLVGVYLLVNRVLLVPAVPDAAAPGDQLAAFVMHARGLPRLTQPEREAFLMQQVPRLLRDEPLRSAFLGAIRTASPEDQEAFRNNLFDTFKPILLRDARAYAGLDAAGRTAFLDERIVAYNRLGAQTDLHVSRHDLGAAAPSADKLLDWLMSKTTEEERRLCIGYGTGLAGRIKDILADEALKAEFERRIAAPN